MVLEKREVTLTVIPCNDKPSGMRDDADDVEGAVPIYIRDGTGVWPASAP